MNSLHHPVLVESAIQESTLLMALKFNETVSRTQSREPGSATPAAGPDIARAVGQKPPCTPFKNTKVESLHSATGKALHKLGPCWSPTSGPIATIVWVRLEI